MGRFTLILLMMWLFVASCGKDGTKVIPQETTKTSGPFVRIDAPVRNGLNATGTTAGPSVTVYPYTDRYAGTFHDFEDNSTSWGPDTLIRLHLTSDRMVFYFSRAIWTGLRHDTITAAPGDGAIYGTTTYTDTHFKTYQLGVDTFSISGCSIIFRAAYAHMMCPDSVYYLYQFSGTKF